MRKTIPNPITLSDLEEKGRCEAAYIKFKQLWPKGLELTLANLLLAAEQGFDLEWGVRAFLPVPLLVEYERQMTQLLTEYQRQKALLLVKYQHQEVQLIWELIAPILASQEGKEETVGE